jgi:hypothetical protein
MLMALATEPVALICRVEAPLDWVMVPAPAAVALCKALAHRAQQRVVSAYGLALDQRAGVFQGLADLLAARHLAHAGAAGRVAEDHQIARKKRPVRPAEVEQHAVVAGHRNDLHANDGGRGMAECHGER